MTNGILPLLILRTVPGVMRLMSLRENEREWSRAALPTQCNVAQRQLIVHACVRACVRASEMQPDVLAEGLAVLEVLVEVVDRATDERRHPLDHLGLHLGVALGRHLCSQLSIKAIARSVVRHCSIWMWIWEREIEGSSVRYVCGL